MAQNNLPDVPASSVLSPSEIVTTFALYEGVAQNAISDQAIELLRKPIPLEDLDILPTGEVYASQVRYRRILNDAFGPGGWGLVPVGGPMIREQSLYREYALYAHGKFVSQAIGEAEYHESNARMSWASAAEAAKSNALTRACKDLGIASECWDRHYVEQFKATHCIQVWVDKKDRPQWRLVTSQPFYGERGPVDPAPTPTRPRLAAVPTGGGTPPPPTPGAGEDARSSPPRPATPAPAPSPPSPRADLAKLASLLAGIPDDMPEGEAREHVISLLDAWPPESHDAVIKAASFYTMDGGQAKFIRSAASLRETYSRGTYAGKPVVSDKWCYRSLLELVKQSRKVLG